MGLIEELRGLFRRPRALQVAMLCTRPGPEGPEILLVKSLDSGRWIIPKGWPMPGRTLAESAAAEAWEEAGARGRVLPGEIARYPYLKRRHGGLDVPADIAVFRMEETTLAEDYPEAGKRKRRFLPAPKAAARADVEELAELIRRTFP